MIKEHLTYVDCFFGLLPLPPLLSVAKLTSFGHVGISWHQRIYEKITGVFKDRLKPSNRREALRTESRCLPSKSQ